MPLFKEFEPKQFETYCEALQARQLFQCNVSSTSKIFYLRFKAIRTLLLKQRKLTSNYREWFQQYLSKRKHMAAEINEIIADESLDDIPMECTIKLMKIAQEYLKNLMVDPKNRSKYTSAYERISQYIMYSEITENDDNSSDEVNKEADDIVGSIFERMLKIARHCTSLRQIAPMYLCWLLEHRLLKITDPKTDKVNLLLTDSKTEDLFPLKKEWHASKPSVSDQSRVYLFDEICALWEYYVDDNTALSRFLFEKTLPYYRDFMKSNHSIQAPNTITHQYVDYNIAIFSNDLLQRGLSVFHDMLELQLFKFPIPLISTDDMFRSAYKISKNYDIGKLLPELYTRCFQRSESYIQEQSNTKRKIKINSKALLNETNRILLEKPLLDRFKNLMFLNPIAYGALYRNDQSERSKWQQEFEEWVMDIRASMNFEWEIQVQGPTTSTSDLQKSIREFLQQDEALFIINTFVIIYSMYIINNIVKNLVMLSKEMFFYEQYSEAQYQKLIDFCI